MFLQTSRKKSNVSQEKHPSPKLRKNLSGKYKEDQILLIKKEYKLMNQLLLV